MGGDADGELVGDGEGEVSVSSAEEREIMDEAMKFTDDDIFMSEDNFNYQDISNQMDDWHDELAETEKLLLPLDSYETYDSKILTDLDDEISALDDGVEKPLAKEKPLSLQALEDTNLSPGGGPVEDDNLIAPANEELNPSDDFELDTDDDGRRVDYASARTEGANIYVIVFSRSGQFR